MSHVWLSLNAMFNKCMCECMCVLGRGIRGPSETEKYHVNAVTQIYKARKND